MHRHKNRLFLHKHNTCSKSEDITKNLYTFCTDTTHVQKEEIYEQRTSSSSMTLSTPVPQAASKTVLTPLASSREVMNCLHQKKNKNI